MRTKVTLVLIFLNVALFFFIFKFERHWRTEAASLEARRRVLGAETADIRSIVVTSSAPNGSYRLDRKDRENWSLTSPLDWPANPHAINSIINELRLLEHETSFPTSGLSKIGQSLADYGLEKPKLTIAFTSGDPTGGPLPPTILRIGDTSPDGSRLYVLSPNGDVIHVVPRSLVDRLAIPLDQLRADTVVTIPVFEARSLRVEASNADQARAGTGSVRVRVRRDGPRWTFDTPITARASKPAVELAINQLNGLHPKSFNPVAPAVLPSAAPALRVALEGNNRYETLFIGEPVPGNPAAPAKPTPGEAEYYAQLENRAVLFTVVVPDDLIDKLRNAPEKLRETQILDFDRQAVTSITLAAPVQANATPVVLQRLEATTNTPDGAAWQIVRRGDGAQGLQTTPADRAAVKRLLDQLTQLSATAFVSDNPSSADLENWGFNRPEREITLTLAAAAPIASAVTPGPTPVTANSTLVLQLGKDASQKLFARVGTPAEPGRSIYAVTLDLPNELPIEPIAWRDRTVALVPPNARITALKVTEFPARRTVFDTTFEANGQPAAGTRQADAAQKLAKLLPALHARRFRPEAFGSEEHIWRYQLDVTFALPAGATAAERTETKALLLSERLGGNEQLAGSKELDLLFDLDQAFIDTFFPLADGARDPGPVPEAKK
jgi:hypothetical protein